MATVRIVTREVEDGLFVEIPDEIVERLGYRPGMTFELCPTGDGGFTLTPIVPDADPASGTIPAPPSV